LHHYSNDHRHHINIIIIIIIIFIIFITMAKASLKGRVRDPILLHCNNKPSLLA